MSINNSISWKKLNMCSSIIKDTLYVIFLTCVFLPSYSLGDVVGINQYNESWTLADLESSFGTRIGSDGIKGFLDMANPTEACVPIQKRSTKDSKFGNVTFSAFVLIKSGGCDFGLKVFYAQQAKYDGAIVYNEYTDDMIRMSSADDQLAQQIDIPSVFVGLTSGNVLRNSFLHETGIYPYVYLYSNGDPLSFKYYIIPFCIVLGTCTMAMVGFFVSIFVRFVRNRHRQRRNRLSRQRLKQLPIKVFAKGDEYDVCAICLDDYEEGEKLRVLPCNHAYHCKCVDPWLTTSKRVCPLCKRRVLSDDETSTSGSEYDDNDTVSDTSEEAHLLQHSSAASPNAARFATGFSSQNPFRRNYAYGSWNSATPTEPSSSLASNIPSSSGHRNSVQTQMPSVMRDNELSPEFYLAHENLPNQLAVLADRWPESPSGLAEVSSSLLHHLSDASSSGSSDGTPLRSYVVDPDEYTVIESTPSDPGVGDVITITGGVEETQRPPFV